MRKRAPDERQLAAGTGADVIRLQSADVDASRRSARFEFVDCPLHAVGHGHDQGVARPLHGLYVAVEMRRHVDSIAVCRAGHDEVELADRTWSVRANIGK